MGDVLDVLKHYIALSKGLVNRLASITREHSAMGTWKIFQPICPSARQISFKSDHKQCKQSMTENGSVLYFNFKIPLAHPMLLYNDHSISFLNTFLNESVFFRL